jgi:c-di-GMP-binding flagellar brake protein YcgR
VQNGVKSEVVQAPSGEERRRYSRHRMIGRLFIVLKDGTTKDATSFEISVGGISAATTHPLKVGEQVTLWPVVSERVAAVIRRNSGTMYGFEFIGLKPEIRERIQEICKKLPPFQTMLDL